MWQITPLKDTDVTLLETLVPSARALVGHDLTGAVAAWWGEELLGVGGIQTMWEGVGNCWIVLVPGRLNGMTRLRPALAVMRLHMRAAIEVRGMWRLQGAVRADFLEAIKLAEVLGGQPEGLMRQYGPDGADYWLYSWVRKHE